MGPSEEDPVMKSDELRNANDLKGEPSSTSAAVGLQFNDSHHTKGNFNNPNCFPIFPRPGFASQGDPAPFSPPNFFPIMVAKS